MLGHSRHRSERWDNEALELLGFLTSGAVEEPPRATPPATPAPGACYIVGGSPTGGWVGRSANLACYGAGGYRFIPPFEGLSVLIRSTGTFAIYRQGAWDLGGVMATKIVVNGQQVVGGRAGGIATPAAGTVIDVQCREALGQVLAAMRQHGLIAA